VVSVFAAGAAVFTDTKFLRSVGFVAFGDVVEVSTLGAL